MTRLGATQPNLARMPRHRSWRVQGQCGEAASLDTPLHMATAAGNVGFVERLVRADPSAAVSPNAKVRGCGRGALASGVWRC